MPEQDETIQEIQSQNKHKALQQKRMQTIKTVAGLLGIQELRWIYTEIYNMIQDIEKKNHKNVESPDDRMNFPKE